ncbi:MAG: putative toxin-antitoxin system toxin component, PIN family [Bdellovibrio sp.]|nr:MAG: putative toxin-antitoxin system toxin component, PIN family [Bdellovibrio sp.]
MADRRRCFQGHIVKVILDTNVIIAAFATQGLCHLVLESVIAHHELILSEFILAEVNDKLRQKIKLPLVRANEITVFLKSHSTVGRDPGVPGLNCRDKDDLPILFLAAFTGADVIISEDEDLLILGSISSTAIVSPREFWDMLRNK